jgi:hypothetical protein
MYKFIATRYGAVPPFLDVSFQRRIGDNALMASIRLITATSLLLVGGVGVGVGAYDTTTLDLGRGPVSVFVPDDYHSDTPVPLVMLLHGRTSSGALQERYTSSRSTALKMNPSCTTAVVFPDACGAIQGPRPAWSSGLSTTTACRRPTSRAHRSTSQPPSREPRRPFDATARIVRSVDPPSCGRSTVDHTSRSSIRISAGPCSITSSHSRRPYHSHE